MSADQKKFDWFEPIKVGAIQAKNRMFLSSLTRQRGDLEGNGNDLVLEHYKQRTGFGIVFSEASQICQIGHGYPGSVGIYTKKHMEFWKKVVTAVHKDGSKMIIQLWHVGRVTEPSINGGQQPLSSSAIAINSTNPITKNPYPVPKEMTIEEIKETIQQYRKSAELAKEAGFDGVEFHAANGYLPDQFLKDGMNTRTDEYGGSIENRIRFTLECMDQLIEVFGADRVGLKLSPTGRFVDQYDSNPLELYGELIKELEKRKIAFIQMKESGDNDKHHNPDGKVPAKEQIPDCCKAFRHLFTGCMITNDGFNYKEGAEKGKQKCQDGYADAMTFGRLSLSNPDLPQRVKNGWPLNFEVDWDALFGGGERGYNTYPFYKPKKDGCLSKFF